MKVAFAEKLVSRGESRERRRGGSRSVARGRRGGDRGDSREVGEGVGTIVHRSYLIQSKLSDKVVRWGHIDAALGRHEHN